LALEVCRRKPSSNELSTHKSHIRCEEI